MPDHITDEQDALLIAMGYQDLFLHGPDMNRKQLLVAQPALLEKAIERATKEKVLETLPVLVQEAWICCNSVEERFNKLGSWVYKFLTPYAMQEVRMMLSTATIAYRLAEQINRLLLRLDMPDLESLSLDVAFRDRLYDARNILAEHYFEHMLYWRLEGTHTPMVRHVYEQHGNPEGPEGPLDELVLSLWRDVGRFRRGDRTEACGNREPGREHSSPETHQLCLS